MSKIVTVRNIIASFAKCIIAQSPYPKVDNIADILEDIRLHLCNKGLGDELDYTDKFNIKLYKQVTDDELFDIIESVKEVESFSKLNITKVELDAGITDYNDKDRSVKYVAIGRGMSNARNRDFIDLDACIRSVYNDLE